jgi:hypothetical protein
MAFVARSTLSTIWKETIRGFESSAATLASGVKEVGERAILK